MFRACFRGSEWSVSMCTFQLAAVSVGGHVTDLPQHEAFEVRQGICTKPPSYHAARKAVL